MTKLTKSFSLFKERSCCVAMVLDRRTNKKGSTEFPLALRFTIWTSIVYLRLSGSYTEKQFSDICNAARSASENYRIQKEWVAMYSEKYKQLLQNINPGGSLTIDMVRVAVLSGNANVTPSQEENSFVKIWEDLVLHLKTDDDGKRFTTGESYECALKSFKKILGEVRGFEISAAEIQRWKDGMLNGVKGKNGKLVGKISETTSGIYLRAARVVWNKCLSMGYLKDTPYPFSNKKEEGKVSIPVARRRKQQYLNISQMTELYNLFMEKRYPESWTDEHREAVHFSLGLFLVQYLCNGFNLADEAELTYDDYYFQTQGKAFRFNRKKTAGRSQNGAEVIVPVIPQLQNILNEIAATPEHGALVFPNILKGAKNEIDKRKRTSQENKNVLKRMRQVCHEVLHWNKSITPSGTWARHSFANNLHSEGVDMDYISESMGHSIPDHSVTQMYIDHYPLEKQMEYNKKLLPSDGPVSPRDALIARLSTMSDEDIAKLLNVV